MLRKFFQFHRSPREEGQVLVLFAGALVVLFGFVGMSIDIGHLVYAKSDLQKVADAAALAGAQDLPGSTADASVKAQEYATLNGGITTEVTFTGTEKIHVTTKRDVNFTFLRVLGLDKATPAAKASARAAQESSPGTA